MAGFSLIVEGDEDVRFLEDFIEYHFGKKIDRTSFILVGGKSESLHQVQVDIQKSSENNRNVLIFDADDKDFQTTSDKINIQMGKLNLKFHSTFLFPNNAEQGNLESLLMKSVTAGNEKLFVCIEDYAKCKLSLGLKKPRPITEKEKIFIYHGSFEDSKSAQGSKRSYFDASIWDLKCQNLEPLKEFLKTNLFI